MEIIERSLQELGKSLFVCLPKNWANTFKLKKGSKIKIMTSEQGFLSIAPEFTTPEKQKETELDYDSHFQRHFFREYFAGNERITINFKTKITNKERGLLYNFLKRFISVQIVEENESKIILKSFKIEELTIEECMKRLYYLSLNMIEEVYSGNDKVILGEIRDNMTRFYYLMVMQIRRFLEEGKFTKEHQISLIRAMDYRMVGEKIQRIGEIVNEFEKIKNKEIEKFLKTVEEHYSKTVLYFIGKNYNKAPNLWKQNETLKKEYQKILTKIKKTKKLEEYKQITDISQILKYAKDISGLIR